MGILFIQWQFTQSVHYKSVPRSRSKVNTNSHTEKYRIYLFYRKKVKNAKYTYIALIFKISGSSQSSAKNLKFISDGQTCGHNNEATMKTTTIIVTMRSRMEDSSSTSNVFSMANPKYTKYTMAKARAMTTQITEMEINIHM